MINNKQKLVLFWIQSQTKRPHEFVGTKNKVKIVYNYFSWFCLFPEYQYLISPIFHMIVCVISVEHTVHIYKVMNEWWKYLTYLHTVTSSVIFLLEISVTHAAYYHHLPPAICHLPASKIILKLYCSANTKSKNKRFIYPFFHFCHCFEGTNKKMTKEKHK